MELVGLTSMHGLQRTDLASEYAQRLANNLGGERVSLFGSRTRGEGRPRSDFDLMVVLRQASGKNREIVHRLATDVELEHDYTVDLSTKITDAERFERLLRSPLPFWQSFNRDEKVLWPPTGWLMAARVADPTR